MKNTPMLENIINADNIRAALHKALEHFENPKHDEDLHMTTYDVIKKGQTFFARVQIDAGNLVLAVVEHNTQVVSDLMGTDYAWALAEAKLMIATAQLKKEMKKVQRKSRAKKTAA